MIVDKRDQIGGNAQDEYDSAGVFVHKYGPHYFLSNSHRIVDYLSQFTEWKQVDYKILSHTEEQYWKFPINLNIFEQMIGRPSTEEDFIAYLNSVRIPIENP